MGCDINSWVEVRDGVSWKINMTHDYPSFDDRNYRVFAFLADVRNDYGVEPICSPRGLPHDSEYLNTKLDKPRSMSFAYCEPNMCYTIGDEKKHDINHHSFSYITLTELLGFDYEKEFENLGVTRVNRGANYVMFGAAFNSKGNVGEGTMTTYRDFLGEDFFKDIEAIKNLGAPDDVRVVFYFD